MANVVFPQFRVPPAAPVVSPAGAATRPAPKPTAPMPGEGADAPLRPEPVGARDVHLITDWHV